MRWRRRRRRWHLLLAAASSIDAGIVSAWQSAGVLATAQRTDGRVPVKAQRASCCWPARLLHVKATPGSATQLVSAEQRRQRPAEQRRQLAALATSGVHRTGDRWRPGPVRAARR
jgi:hypothetical protein